ncbi:MAG: hypothetical protein WC374_12285 [Phycisphaerae bacterium]|jgi:hypothetical protein
MEFDINDPKVKAAIQPLIEAAVAEATEGLKNKNGELLAKLKKAQKDSTIDPAEFSALQENLSATEAKLAEALKMQKQLQTEADKSKKAYESETKFVSTLLIDNGLTEAIIKAGVKPEMAKAVKAMLAGQVTLKVEGDKRTAMIGDKSLSDAVGEWAKSDEGKHFVTAPDNSGGGANGGGQGKGNVKTMTRSAFEALDAPAKMAFTKEGGSITQ